MENLQADVSKPAEGVVIEAYLDPLRGPTATLLLTGGILEPGCIVGTPSTLGKLKNLENFKGIAIQKAYPSMPTIAFGFENVPKVGEEFKVFSDLESAEKNIQKAEKKAVIASIEEPDKKTLNLILKADVLGSI